MSSARLPVFEKFIQELRAAWAELPDTEARMKRGQTLLENLVQDPSMREASKSWPSTEGRKNLLFYEDADYGFAINGVVRVPGRKGSIHDHAHAWTAYGILDGTESLERFRRIDDGSKQGGASPPSWRASLSASSGGSRPVVVMDSAGVQFASGRWLAIIANIVEAWKQPDEVTALQLASKGMGGFFSLDLMPGDLRKALGRGMTIHVVAETYRAWLPLGSLLQMASVPAAVKARLLQVNFQLDRSELEAVRDFASRLSPP